MIKLFASYSRSYMCFFVQFGCLWRKSSNKCLFAIISTYLLVTRVDQIINFSDSPEFRPTLKHWTLSRSLSIWRTTIPTTIIMATAYDRQVSNSNQMNHIFEDFHSFAWFTFFISPFKLILILQRNITNCVHIEHRAKRTERNKQTKNFIKGTT